jgi:hypothetical protein
MGESKIGKQNPIKEFTKWKGIELLQPGVDNEAIQERALYAKLSRVNLVIFHAVLLLKELFNFIHL